MEGRGANSMTYYEELGLPADASREELRQAYKHLVRLLHPDQCTEDTTRHLADLQMKRLNGILSMLLDPERRAAYDRSLFAGPAKRIDPFLWLRDQRWQRPSAAIGGALLVLVVCAVFPLHPPPHPTPHPTPHPQVARAGGLTAILPQPKPSRRSAPRDGHRAAAVDQESPAEVLSGYQAEAPPAHGEPHAAEPAPATPEPAKPDEWEVPHTPQTIAGEWFFVPSPAIKNTEYPPEYIELRVSEDHGAIRGRYRARYRVADRAISPNVAFQFEGRTLPEGGVLPWRGAGGSQGEITLRLLANGDLDVEWIAEQMGEELGLISGKARLIRKLD
jgi:DnaJ domain